MTRAELIALEEAAARAWPPRRIVRLAGWEVRLSGGGSKRANSVQCLRFEGAGLEAAITRAETLYAREGQPAIFQVATVSAPDGLDAALAARGYAAVDTTLMRVKRVAPVPMPDAVTVSADPPEHWFAVYLSTLTPDRRATARFMVEAVPRPRAFFLVRREGVAVACALGVAEGPYCGIECVATLADARRTGAARALMQALEAWAAAQGAATLWLQVMETNAPARALYDALGFATVGGYTYRIKI
jgi:N-acetylglutamate synthase